MTRTFVLSLCIILLTGLCLAQPPALRAQLKATLDLTDRPTAEVVAEVSRQIEAQVGIVGPGAPEKVTLSLKEASADQAVAALADALGASWMRAYLLESQPPAMPFTADQLFAGLESQRNNWFESLTEPQRQAVMARAMLAPPPAPGTPPPAMPGAGKARPPAGQQPAPPGLGRYDAVRNLTLPNRTEGITLKLQDQPLKQALFDLTTASGFLVAAGADLTGSVTLTADQQPLEQVIADLAGQVQAQWRPIYLLSVPRQLSDAETEQMIDQGLQDRLGQFWAKPPEERAEEVQKWVGRLSQWGQMAKQPGQDGRPNMVAQGMQTLGPKVLSWLVQYSAGLSPDRRNEINPLIRALGQAVAGR